MMMSFIVIGVIGVVLLIAAMFGDELWVTDDGHTSAWLSPRAVAVFMTWYGAFGGLLYHYKMASYVWSSILAVAWSGIATGVVISILNWCVKQECSTGTGIEIVGRTGVVISEPKDDGFMMIMMQFGELQQEFMARCNGNVHEGDRVTVVDRNGSICYVVKQSA